MALCVYCSRDCDEYHQRHLETFMEQELLQQPSLNLMDTRLRHRHINTLFTWQVEVVYGCYSSIEAFDILSLTMNIQLRYLSRFRVPIDKLQLIGYVAMFIASKIIAVKTLYMNYKKCLSATTYTMDEIKTTEITMIQELKYFTCPSATEFISEISNVTGDEYEYILKIILLYLCHFPQETPVLPSLQALAGYYTYSLINEEVKFEPRGLLGYNMKDIQETSKDMLHIYNNATANEKILLEL